MLFTPGECCCQIFIILERAVNVEIVAWRLRKPAVVVSHELFSKGVCGLRCTDTAEPQLLDEAILQRQVSPLNTALGRTGIGTDTGDVQLVHGTAKLSLAISADGLLVVDPEDTDLVAVECQRLTVTLQVAPGGLKIGESGLRTDEQKLHQPAGRIINVNEQRAGRTTILEPAMLTAINLDEFFGAGPTRSWLMHTRRP